MDFLGAAFRFVTVAVISDFNVAQIDLGCSVRSPTTLSRGGVHRICGTAKPLGTQTARIAVYNRAAAQERCRDGETMIVGMGLDITEVDRMEGAIVRHGAPFLERLFTPVEVAYCERYKNRYEHYAARFAAKEAAMKALGT